MKIAHLLSALLLTLQITGCAQLMANLSGPGVTDENPGTRTVGMVVEDTNIETKILGNLYKTDSRFEKSHVRVASYNGVVLLVGQVPDAAMIQRATDIAKRMRGVRNVHSEMQVATPAPLKARSKDAWIRGKIKTIMYATRDFPASRIKVVTESGVVYLMGLVTEQEANETISIIQNIDGIKRIVKIFEYIPDQNARPTSPL